MPAKRSFDRETIINAAFNIIRTKGRKSLSARTLANSLESSTMPIYSMFSSMKALEKDLERKAFDLFAEYTNTVVTGDSYTDISWGYIRFARDEKELFKLMFLDSRSKNVAAYKKNKEFILGQLTRQLRQSGDFDDLSDSEMARAMEFNEIFIHGISSLIVSGRLENQSDDHILSLIKEIREFLVRGKTLSEYIQKLKQGAKSLASKIELSE